MEEIIVPGPGREPGREARPVSITLCLQAYRDFSDLAEWQGMALATLLRQVLETEHRSPGLRAAIREARAELQRRREEEDSDENYESLE